MPRPIRNIIHHIAQRNQPSAHALPPTQGYPVCMPPVHVVHPQLPAAYAFPPPQPPLPALPVDESNALGAKTIRVSSPSGRWHKVGIELDLPLDERPSFIFQGKTRDDAPAKISGMPLDGSFTIEDNHIKVERTLVGDGTRARYTVFYHQAGCGLRDANFGFHHDGPDSGAATDKDLLVITKDGSRHLLKVRGNELLSPAKPEAERLPEEPKQAPRAALKAQPPTALDEVTSAKAGEAPLERVIRRIPDESPARPPVPTPQTPATLPPPLKPMPGELQPKALILPKDRATPKEQMPPAPPASPPPAPAVKTERSPKSSPSVVSSDLGFNAAKQFIRSQFAECDITTFDVDEGDKNWLKAATSQDRLSLSTEDTRRLERALRKSKMDTLPVGSVLEHRLSSYRHRMVLRKFSNDVFALDTAGMHKEKSSDEEGFVCDSIIFARNKSGKWFLLPYTRLVTSYRGAMETRMNEKVRTRLSWLEMGAEGATGHSLASYSPERPTYTNFLAKRSPKDAPIHRVPTHDIPFCQVVAGENGIGGELAEKIERVLGQLESGIPKIGRYLRFEQNWGHAIYVMKLAENSYAIQTHTQRTAENGITLNGVDVMMVRRAEGGKHWEIAQLEFNGTDFVAVAEPDRYLGKDGRYDARFSMIEAGLAKQK